MERFETTVEIAVPLRTAYNQWTQFEEFPQFMHDVRDVVQTDDTHMHWLVSVAGQRLEWDTEITEQVPDELIEWRSCSGVPNAGEARFDALDDERTRFCLVVEYELEITGERSGETIGLVAREIEKSVEQFKDFIEKRGVETGGWRGEVHDARRSGPAGVGTPEEPLPGGDPVGGVPDPSRNR
jgi:uncharacterized membrane protein